MGTVVYKWTNGATNLSFSSGISMSVSQTGSFPSEQYKITDYSIIFSVIRSGDNLGEALPNVYIGSSSGTKIGTLIGLLSYKNQYYYDIKCTTVSALKTITKVFEGITKLYVKGEDYSGSVRGGCTVTLSIDYELTTSAATAPTKLTVSATLSEGDVTLSGSGAKAGTNNAITGYEIQYSDSSDNKTWGSRMALKTVSATATSFSTSVAPPSTRGNYRRFRVRTRGAAGSSYYSDWITSTNTVRRNQAPGAPGAVSVSPAIYESGGITVAWTKATDADSNLDHYLVQYQLEGGAWTKANTTTALTLTHSPSVSRGERVRYRVQAVDTFSVASAAVISGYVLRNQAPLVPAILYPPISKTTYNQAPFFVLTIPQEPNGQTQTLYYTVDSQSALSLGAVTTGTKKVRLASMAEGSHVIAFYLQDSQGAKSAVTQRTITIAPCTFDREVIKGTPLEGASQDLKELLSHVNTVRAYYGLEAVAFMLSTKHFHTWMQNVTLLRNGLIDCCGRSGAVAPTWTSRANNQPPSAAVINELRNAILNM